ncbi:MAG: hypothetical protein WBG19_01655 [Thermoplasmata archaeon]
MDATRTIVPLMAFTVIVTLVGHTLEPTKVSKLDPHVGDAQILLGGTIATVLLTLLAQAGEVGERFGKGLAVVALLGSVGVYGTSVLGGLNRITGQTKPTTAVKPTASTKGTK